LFEKNEKKGTREKSQQSPARRKWQMIDSIPGGRRRKRKKKRKKKSSRQLNLLTRTRASHLEKRLTRGTKGKFVDDRIKKKKKKKA